MNGIVRSASALRGLLSTSSPGAQVARSLWRICERRPEAPLAASARLANTRRSQMCGCGCCRSAHTKAEKDLVAFLAEEIVAERKAQKLKTIPSELEGFKVSLDGAEVTLEKAQGPEKIRISFNINHSVDAPEEPELDPNSDNVDIGEMKSKPTFTVDIIRDNQTLGFTCSFNDVPGASGADESFNDIFGIDEITLYQGEHTDKTYAVAGQVMDGYLYDLLMNYLEAKGVSNEFAEKLVELSTSYEHTAYVSLLEGLSKFTAGN